MGASTSYALCMHAGWWFDPDWIINELGINSTITSPAHEEVVTLDSQKDYVIRGYAYSSAHPCFLPFTLHCREGRRSNQYRHLTHAYASCSGPSPACCQARVSPAGPC